MEKKKRGRPKKADVMKKQESDVIYKVAAVIGVMLFVGIFAQNLWSDTITFKFKSPSNIFLTGFSTQLLLFI